MLNAHIHTLEPMRMHAGSEPHTVKQSNLNKCIILRVHTKHKNTHVQRYSQDNDCDHEHGQVKSSPETVSGGCLLLVHLPTAVATAATASQEETDDGHQDDVQNADGNTHQETRFVDQNLNTKRTDGVTIKTT